jgi:hypothetical protein
MSSKRGAAKPRGAQRPRSLWVPPYESSCGDEAVELCEIAGLHLDPWQEFVLRESLGERADGTWAALEVGVEVSRQNGKGGLLEARQLTGLFLLEEPFQVHSAHQFDTSLEAYRRLLQLIEETPEFDQEVLKATAAHGVEGIELRGNRRIRFRTRTAGGGRGFSGETLYLDEAMFIKEATHGSLFPILSAMPNPQIWYTGSAVNQEEHPDGLVFARIRQRGLWDEDPRLAWFGWGHCPKSEHEAELLPEEAGELLDDREAWAAANPGLGIRIDPEFIEAERRSLGTRNFAVERLGIGDWPSTTGVDDELFDRDEWAAVLDLTSRIASPPVLALDVSPDRSSSSIASAGERADGLLHIELVDRRRGTGWVAERMAQLAKNNGVSIVVVDGRSQAASLIPEIEGRLGFEVTAISTAEYAQACGNFFDAVPQKTLRHIGQAELDAAVQGAATRPLGDGAWAWSRKKSTVDITPLVACTLARWGAAQGEEVSVYNDQELLVLD